MTSMLYRFSVSGALCMLISMAAYGQIDTTPADDAFRELEEQELTLRFFNALDGEPIPGGEVEIGNVGSFTIDREGRAFFPIPTDSIYKVTFSKAGFITSSFDIEIMAGSLFFNRFSVSPQLPLGSIRVVLDWGEEPKDLDAHLLKQDGYHISYRNMKSSQDGVARLDRDDTSSFGPETITANQVDANVTYHYFVHDYSNRSNASSQTLSKSKATVKVYGESRLLNVFKVPQYESGIYWHVFSIRNGEQVPVGDVSQQRP